MNETETKVIGIQETEGDNESPPEGRRTLLEEGEVEEEEGVTRLYSQRNCQRFSIYSNQLTISPA